jgi:hypothetical protein
VSSNCRAGALGDSSFRNSSGGRLHKRIGGLATSHVLAGRDLLRNVHGTWLGVTRDDRVALLTNFNDHLAPRSPESLAALVPAKEPVTYCERLANTRCLSTKRPSPDILQGSLSIISKFPNILVAR